MNNKTRFASSSNAKWRSFEEQGICPHDRRSPLAREQMAYAIDWADEMPNLYFDWNDGPEKDGTYLCSPGEYLSAIDPVVLYEVGQEVTFGDSEISCKGIIVSKKGQLLRVARTSELIYE